MRLLRYDVAGPTVIAIAGLRSPGAGSAPQRDRSPRPSIDPDLA
jgi:hypothetical protein